MTFMRATPFPSRLTWRIYAVGILQFALVAAGMFVFIRETARAPQQSWTHTARLLVESIEPKLHDHSLVARELTELERETNWAIAIYDSEGTLVARTQRPPARADSERGFRPGAGSSPLRFPNGSRGTLLYTMPPRPAPPHPWFPVALVLLVVGVTSWFTARSLTVPLVSLSKAVSALGAGQLATRATVKRNDELGDLARTFNEMAQRITTLVRAEKELIANVSHELRTPLARIRVALDLAADGDAESARQSIREIAEDLTELERIVGDVLTAARLSLTDGVVNGSSMPPIRVEEVDLQTLLERSIGRFRVLHPARPLEFQCASILPNAEADPVLLRRVLDNLLDNADKYTEEPAALIVVAAYRAGGAIVIEVRDQGIGIAPEDSERVFEPFFRAERSRARATGGYGLGLALARRIIEAHAGKLRLSPRPGGGTVARIDLPIAARFVSSSRPSPGLRNSET